MKTRSVNSRINSGRTASMQLNVSRLVFDPGFSRIENPATVLAALEYGLTTAQAITIADLSDCSDEYSHAQLSGQI